MAEAVYPQPDEIEAQLREAAGGSGGCAEIKAIGKSIEGRDILSARVTDPSVPDDDKQHALIIAGQHGGEESGRLGALAVVKWLCSDDPGAAETRRKQLVVIVPCLNPDGTVRDVRGNANDVNLNRQYDPEAESRELEAEHVMGLAEELMPDMLADMHGLTSGGHDDLILIGGHKTYTEDVRLHHEIARDMVAGAEEAGYPMCAHPVDWSGWELQKPDCLIGYAYWRFHPIVFLTEGDEATLDAERMAGAGFERMKPLILTGNRRHQWFRYEGYPNGMIGGVVRSSIRAAGATAAERRRNRAEVWPEIRRFPKAGPKRGAGPVKEFEIEFDEGKSLETGFALARRLSAGAKPVSAAFDGREIPAGEGVPGYVTWSDRCSTFVQLSVERLEAGKHSAEIILAD